MDGIVAKVSVISDACQAPQLRNHAESTDSLKRVKVQKLPSFEQGRVIFFFFLKQEYRGEEDERQTGSGGKGDPAVLSMSPGPPSTLQEDRMPRWEQSPLVAGTE